MTENKNNTTLPMATGGASCNCCSVDEKPASGSSEAAVSARYDVEGMTCAHCVAAVTEEVGAIPGVTGVDVALDPGKTSRVTVRSDAPVDAALVRAAVAEAGYEVAPA